MLLANAAVDNSQRVSVLAAAAPNNSNLTNESSNDDFMKSVSYGSVSSVLRQCDKPSSFSSDQRNPVTSNSASTVPQHNKYRRNNDKSERRKLSPEQLADLKSRSKCHKCSKYGHWSSEHNSDGSLKANAKSTDEPSNAQHKRNVASFNMANVSSSHFANFPSHLGPLVDDGAPYAAVVQCELDLLQPRLLPNWDGTLDPIPDTLSGRRHWQYGCGEHASSPRLIVGSICLPMAADCGSTIIVRHLILEGSSQWVIGRNVTSQCDIVHVNGNMLSVPTSDSTRLHITMTDHNFHSYIPYNEFCRINSLAISANLASASAEKQSS